MKATRRKIKVDRKARDAADAYCKQKRLPVGGDAWRQYLDGWIKAGPRSKS